MNADDQVTRHKLSKFSMFSWLSWFSSPGAPNSRFLVLLAPGKSMVRFIENVQQVTKMSQNVTTMSRQCHACAIPLLHVTPITSRQKCRARCGSHVERVGLCRLGPFGRHFFWGVGSPGGPTRCHESKIKKHYKVLSPNKCHTCLRHVVTCL